MYIHVYMTFGIIAFHGLLSFRYFRCIGIRKSMIYCFKDFRISFLKEMQFFELFSYIL